MSSREKQGLLRRSQDEARRTAESKYYCCQVTDQNISKTFTYFIFEKTCFYRTYLDISVTFLNLF